MRVRIPEHGLESAGSCHRFGFQGRTISPELMKFIRGRCSASYQSIRVVERMQARETTLVSIVSLTDRRSSAAIAPDFNADLVYEAIVRSLWS